MLRIKLLRLSSSLSQWYIAQAAGMSQGRYSMLERGLIGPLPEERERLAKVLQVPVASLFRSVIRERRKRGISVGVQASRKKYH